MKKPSSKYLNYLLLSLFALDLMLLVPLRNSSSPKSMHDQLMDSVGSSVVKLENTAKTSGGTGFQIKFGNEEYIVTNRHICSLQDENNQIEAFSPFLPSRLLHVLSISKKADLCLLEPMIGLPAISLAEKNASYHQHLWALGHPMLRELTETNGYRLDCGEDILDSPWCRSTIPVEPGNSGSPVVNNEGLVEGVIYASSYSGDSFYVPLFDLKEFLSASKPPQMH